MKVFFNSDYTASGYAFDTTRKSAEIAAAIKHFPNVEINDPAGLYEVTEELIRRMHKTVYVHAIKTGDPLWKAESQGFTWDEDIYTMALAHNAGMVAAATEVLSNLEFVAGSLSSGLHHATAREGVGFCTFNGLAVAALAASQLGARRILSLDFDAHCGGGTYGMTRELGVVQVDVATSAFDSYDITDSESRLILCKNPNDYIDTIEGALAYAKAHGPWDLVIYNAGMDPYNTRVSFDDLNRREEMVAEWVMENQYPTIFSMAGGYTWDGVTMKDLVDLHGLTVSAFSAIS